MTPSTIHAYIGGKRPLFVKFYSPDCPHCEDMEEDFANASVLFRDTSFGAINCKEYPDACTEVFGVEGYPSIQLYPEYTNKSIHYNGRRKAEDFVEFVEMNTNTKANRPRRIPLVHQLTPINYDKFIDNVTFKVVLYCRPDVSHCQSYYTRIKKIATAFEMEKNVTVGYLNCYKYTEFCKKVKVTEFPLLYIFRNKRPTLYEGKRDNEEILNYINEFCGTERQMDGLLNIDADVRDDAAEIVGDFITSNNDNRKSYVDSMKELKGTEFYVKIMRRFLANGMDKIHQDVVVMKEILRKRRGSFETLDELTRRMNKFSLFIPKEVKYPYDDDYQRDDEVGNYEGDTDTNMNTTPLDYEPPNLGY